LFAAGSKTRSSKRKTLPPQWILPRLCRHSPRPPKVHLPLLEEEHRLPQKRTFSTRSHLQMRPHQVKELTPPDKIYNKELMLRVWRLQRSEVNPAVLGLGVAKRPWRPNPRSANSSEIRRPETDSPVLEQSEKAYRITKPTSPMEALNRNVCALLNKICPENLDTIVEKLANIELQKAAELECVIKAILGKALVEPHYCETYADMVFALQKKYPEFPPENEGERPLTFTRVMLNTVQNEFESLPTTFEPTDDDKAKFPDSEDLQREMKKRKDKHPVCTSKGGQDGSAHR